MVGIIMLKINFKQEDIQKIRSLNKDHPHPFVRQKSQVLLLKSFNLPHNLIEKISDLSANTIRNYLNNYIENGIESLTEISFYQPQSKLVQFEEIVRKYFDERPPSTIKQACNMELNQYANARRKLHLIYR